MTPPTLLAVEIPDTGLGTISALGLFILASLAIGILANFAMKKGAFLRAFFLGNRGLGPWAMALTATVQSGGTFMGFPSYVYTHGWVVAIWIAGYMVVPLTGFGVLGKRLAQLSRRTGAITVPDFFRERYNSPRLGLTTSLLILFFMCVMMVAQFKAGGIVMKLAWPDTGVLAFSENAEYMLAEESLAALRDADLREESVQKMATLVGRPFADEKEFEDTASPLLTIAEWEEYKTNILAAGKLNLTDWRYLIGLAVFSLTVVGYTLVGGFLAAVWTDLFQSVMMLLGVVALMAMALWAAGGLEQATIQAVANTSPNFAFGPGYDPKGEGGLFLPLGIAFSMFFVWVYAGMASPAGMVRVMASDSTGTLRRSIYLLSFYNALIYIPLVMICICGRAIIPDLQPGQTDAIVPLMALVTFGKLPFGSVIAGLVMAVPFGAVMATVSAYLVVIASGLVRDVYHRFINPKANDYELKRVAFVVMIVVGVLAVAANIHPVDYLQALVVFSGEGQAAAFVVPALMAAFWRRSTTPGVFAAMLGGTAVVLVLYTLGIVFKLGDPTVGPPTRFRPYFLLGIEPIVWGLLTSAIAGVWVSLRTQPPDARVVSKLFDAQEEGSAPENKAPKDKAQRRPSHEGA
ncbi:MAG: sodium:solute symporter [Planctomycetia bacterium]|nr:sodium:solute symporter [Planctomycetia bacterium]